VITKTDAVVLKSMKFRGTSKIVTFYTRRYGKVKGVAKGAREMKSKFGASLEPMMLVSLVLYKKEQRELQLISQCDILHQYKNVHSDMERMSAALSVVELLNKLTHEEEENSLLFALVLETLEAVNHATRNAINVLLAFELRLCSLFGFALSLDRCAACGRAMEGLEGTGVVLQLSKGAVYCPLCSGTIPVFDPERLLSARRSPHGIPQAAERAGNMRLSMPALHILRRLASAKLESVPTLEYHEGVGNELQATLRLYLRYHFEEFKPLRSMEMFHKVLK